MIKKIIGIITKYIMLFLFYGVVYFIIECIWKNKISDIRMLILGGVIGVIIGLINNIFNYETDFLLQCIVGMLIVLLLEATLGYQWNIVKELNIWNYSTLPLSAINGQINLFFSIGWLLLSGVCIILDDYINYIYFNYKKDNPPYYKIFSKKIFQFKIK